MSRGSIMGTRGMLAAALLSSLSTVEPRTYRNASQSRREAIEEAKRQYAKKAKAKAKAEAKRTRKQAKRRGTP